MRDIGRGKRACASGIVRVALLAVLAYCSCPPAWGLSTAEDTLFRLGPPTELGLTLPTLYQDAPQTAVQESPVLGQFKLTLGDRRKLNLRGFGYGGRGSSTKSQMASLLGLTARPDASVETMPVLLPRTALAVARALDDQAQSFQADYDNGRGKLGLSFRNVGAKFPEAAKSLDGADASELKALTEAAGTRSLNLSGSYQLLPGASFSTTRTSLTNDRPGDEKRGLTTTDWVNTLNLTIGKSTSMRFALTDHSEVWDPTTGKTGLSRRTAEFGGESKFGAGGKYSLRFGLTDVTSATSGGSQSEQTQELHLALPVHARLRLSADYTAKEGASGAQTTRLTGAVLQLYPGAELAASLKSLSVGGKETQETFLKFAGDLGHGSSAVKLLAERISTLSPEAKLLTQTKLDLNGGAGKFRLRTAFQEKRGDTPEAPLERNLTFHLDRAFGPRFTLALDHEQRARGTMGAFEADTKSVCGLSFALAPQTKLTAGISSQGGRTSLFTALNRDLILEHSLGSLRFRAEDHARDAGPEQRRETGFGLDWPQGQLPEWANGLTRRHEFGDAYEYLVKRESNWLDLPFAGTRFWTEQRTGGEDDGVRTLLLSHRRVIANRYHVQLTYHERPEFEEGDKKGRPQALRRGYAELGMPIGRGLVGRTWLSAEQSATDLNSQRRTTGLAVLGKLASQAQVELDFSRDSGAWEGEAVERNTLAVFYHRRVDDERNFTLKLGYAWGEDLGNGRDRDCRLTLALANPL